MICNYWTLQEVRPKHYPIRHGPQQWGCPFCFKVYSSSGNAHRHIRVHTGDRPFACPQCDYTATQKSNLQSHINHNHMSNRNKRWASYSSTKHLDWQLFLLQIDGGPLKIGVGKFACPHCPQVMKTSQMIWRHILIHTGEKPFACPHCDFRTNRKSNLTAHVKNQHTSLQLDSF